MLRNGTYSRSEYKKNQESKKTIEKGKNQTKKNQKILTGFEPATLEHDSTATALLIFTAVWTPGTQSFLFFPENRHNISEMY